MPLQWPHQGATPTIPPPQPPGWPSPLRSLPAGAALRPGPALMRSGETQAGGGQSGPGVPGGADGWSPDSNRRMRTRWRRSRPRPRYLASPSLHGSACLPDSMGHSSEPWGRGRPRSRPSWAFPALSPLPTPRPRHPPWRHTASSSSPGASVYPVLMFSPPF